MFLEFYGLKEQPFGVTPDPRFVYPSKTYRKAFHSLCCGIEAGCGFLALIAQPGMGKTTLIFQLLKQLEETSRLVFLFQTQCDSRELLNYVLSNLGLNASQDNIVSMHERLNQVLARERLAGRRFVLIIDECQNLDNTVLEEVRLLSNFETATTKLMQIILAGQTQLADKLSRPDLAQLRQRISIWSRLEPLTPSETIFYIEHRLQVAGYVGPPLFTAGALERILARSQGIPRNINNLCFNSMLAGYAVTRKQIDSAIVDQALADLEMEPRELQRPATQQAATGLPRIPNGIYPGFNSRSAYPDAFNVDLAPEHGHSNSTPEATIRSEVAAPTRQSQVQQVRVQPKKAQFDPSMGQSDLSGRKQVALDNFVAHTAGLTPAQKTPLAARAPQCRAVLSYKAFSGGSRARRAASALALSAAVALTGLLAFYSNVEGSRQLQDQPARSVANVVGPPLSELDSRPVVTSITVAGDARVPPAPIRPSLTGILGLKIGRIVIDPGHGGYDTGTTGPMGLTEKDLSLDIAQRLGRIVEEGLPGAEVVFTRTDDRFIPLEERSDIANKKKADLFLSIHANSSGSPTDRGVETYYLGLSGSPGVMEVAAHENATALETVSDLHELVKKIERNEKIEASRQFAECIQDSLARSLEGRAKSVKNRGVRRAPFVVLIGTNMPAVLAEISFLSNPADEQLLKQDEYCQRIAEGLYQGILGYLQKLNSVAYNLAPRNPAAPRPGLSRSSDNPPQVEQSRDQE